LAAKRQSEVRSLARAQRGGDELARQAFEQKQVQVAVASIVIVIKRQLLLTVGPVFGVIHVQHDHLWRPGVAGDKLLDKGLGQSMGQADLLVDALQQQGTEVG
tara:strand:- start:24784 stop:25092 length:309 start_codon:yes stop_codon:yes gene_type:complete